MLLFSDLRFSDVWLGVYFEYLTAHIVRSSAILASSTRVDLALLFEIIKPGPLESNLLQLVGTGRFEDEALTRLLFLELFTGIFVGGGTQMELNFL